MLIIYLLRLLPLTGEKITRKIRNTVCTSNQDTDYHIVVAGMVRGAMSRAALVFLIYKNKSK